MLFETYLNRLLRLEHLKPNGDAEQDGILTPWPPLKIQLKSPKPKNDFVGTKNQYCLTHAFKSVFRGNLTKSLSPMWQMSWFLMISGYQLLDDLSLTITPHYIEM